MEGRVIIGIYDGVKGCDYVCRVRGATSPIGLQYMPHLPGIFF